MSKIKRVNIKELELLSHRDMVRFALFCAEQVKEGWRDIPECVSAIETVKRWLEGKATALECSEAAYAASTTVYAGTSATYNTYNTAQAAASDEYASYYACAAGGFSSQLVIKEQWEYYEELLHFDDIAEKLLLGGVV